MLVLCKFLTLLVKTLTDDEQYSLLYRDNLTQPIQILLSQKENTFSHFFFAFFEPISNFAHFQKKKMTLIADAFPKLPFPKKVSI